MLDPDPIAVAAGPAESVAHPSRTGDSRTGWDLLALGLRSPGVLAVIAITTAVFVCQLILSHHAPNTPADPIFRNLRGWVPDLNHGQWWRLPGSQFLHFSWAHLRDNMVMLYLFGPLVEATYGRLWFLTAYLTAAVGGVLATIGITHVWGSFAGASVAVFGIHGLVLAIAAHRIRRRGYWIYLTAALVSIALEWSPYTSANWHHNQVHLYGLLTGLLLGVGYEISRSFEHRQQLGRILTTVAVLALAIGVAATGWPHVPAHYIIVHTP